MAISDVPGQPDRGAYPIQLTVIGERELNGLWGIPFVGIFVRGILAIPHFVVLSVLGFCLNVWFLVGWIPILVNGRVPAIAVKLLTEYVQRGTRVVAYVGFLMPGGYPPLEPGVLSPVGVHISLDSLEINRLWGIPLFGYLVRVLILLPHLIVLTFAAIVIALSMLVLWIPILASGRYPDWAVSLYGGFLRYLARVQAYAVMLPVPYPPLWFD